MLLPLIPSKPTSSHGLPDASPGLVRFGLKFTGGGTHISRTIMHEELEAMLSAVLPGSSASDYRDAILQRNVLGKTTDSTRQKSLRHLRELYALDEEVPIFKLLRALHALDAAGRGGHPIPGFILYDPSATPSGGESASGDYVTTGSLIMCGGHRKITELVLILTFHISPGFRNPT
jgi:hypothetical protein